MPEISRFLGISIYMYFNEHNPPHFHVKYNEYRGMMSIQELKLIEGKLPRRAQLLVMEWASDHREELIGNWESIRATGRYQKIEPLVQEEVMVWVTKAKYLKEYQVWLKFNNGQEGIVDLKETIFQDHRAIFQAIKDPAYFRSFILDADTLVWDNGLDLAPEFLYENMKAIESTSVSL